MDPKRAALAALHRAGAFAVVRYARHRSLLIVTYHGVLPGSDDRYDFLSANFVSAAAFERQIRFLASRYTFVTLSQIVDAHRGGRPLPSYAATITFDDGFANNYRVAFPVLQKYGAPCAIFLTTGKIGVPGAQLWTERVKRAIYLTTRARCPLPADDGPVYELQSSADRERAARAVLGTLKRLPIPLRDQYIGCIEAACGRPGLRAEDGIRYDFLTWDEIRAMARAGVEFGSHTVTHPILTTLDDDALARELSESRRMIETELERECSTFAYPNGGVGDFGARERQAVRHAGYRCALSLQGRLNQPSSDVYALDRVNISREFGPALFEATITGLMEQLRRLKSGAIAERPDPGAQSRIGGATWSARSSVQSAGGDEGGQ